MKLDILEIISCLCFDLGLDDFTVNTIRSRFASEGFSFFSKTLPAFAKGIVHCIEVGRINDPTNPHTSVTYFKLGNWDRIPLFMRVQLLKIFNKKGVLLENPDPSALYTIRQVCEYFYKLALDFTESDIEKAIEGFSQVESELEAFVPDRNYIEKLRKRLETYYGLNDTLDVILARYGPRLTPGAFAGSQNISKVWYRHFNEYKRCKKNLVFLPLVLKGLEGLLKPFPGCKLSKWLSGVKIRYVDRSWTSEYLLVPKDGRGPRGISKEPFETIRFQMIFFDYLVDTLYKSSGGRIRFRDQLLHRSLAQRGSEDGSWATMDLKEASDRVPLKVVNALFRNLPVRKLLSLRSEYCLLPNGNRVKLNKLSGMGSGFTFPTMSLLIHLTVCEAIYEHFRYTLSYRTIMDCVYTYGDDLILPSNLAFLVENALSRVGLKLNTNKSFTRGPFRESCGGDYLLGKDVTPLRLKLAGAKLPSKKLIDKKGFFFISGDMAVTELNAHCKNLVNAGLFSLAEYYYKAIEKELKSPLPYISGNSDVIGRYTENYLDVISTSSGTVNGAKCTYYAPKGVNIPRPHSLTRNWDKPKTKIDDFRSDPYVLLADALRPGSNNNSESSVVLGEVGYPRKIKLVKVEPSTIRNLGSHKAYNYKPGTIRFA